MPQPPSPTTTIFFEYVGGSVMAVMAVADDSRPEDDEDVLMVVPSLDRAGRVSRRSVVGRRWMP